MKILDPPLSYHPVYASGRTSQNFFYRDCILERRGEDGQIAEELVAVPGGSRTFPRRHRQRSSKSAIASKVVGNTHGIIPTALDAQGHPVKHQYESSDSDDAAHVRVFLPAIIFLPNLPNG